MSFFSDDSTKVFYNIFGENGPFLVLINGYTRDSKDFYKLAKDISNHSNYRVLVFDNRGSGLTQSSLNFTLEDICDDLFKICKQEKVSNVSLLGISMGGMIAQIFCSKYRDFVKDLILVSTSFSVDFVNDAEKRKWPSNLLQIQNKLRSYFSENFASNNPYLIELMAKQIHQKIDLSNFHERADAQQRAIIKSLKDSRWYNSTVHLNALIIHGEMDQIISLDQAYKLLEKYPKAKLHIQKNCGHLLLAEAYKDLLSQILNFIS